MGWWWQELLGRKSTSEIYNLVSKNGVYDLAVDYADRVARISQVYTHIPIIPKHILDLACGTGANIDALPWKATAKILGVDNSTDMLSLAKKRFVTYKNITLLKQNFFTSLQKKGLYDLITITFATRFVPVEKEVEFVKAVTSHIRPGGYFVIVTADEPWPVWFGKFLTRIRIPRGYNAQMNYRLYLRQRFQPELNVVKEIIPDRRPFVLLRQVGLIFQRIS